MDMIGRIRRLHVRGKKSEREIARLTGLSRNTIARWLHEPVEAVAPRYRRAERPTKLRAFHETLKTALEADAYRPKHERRTSRALFDDIKAKGYAGCYSRVTDFVRAWRLGAGQPVIGLHQLAIHVRLDADPKRRGVAHSQSEWPGRHRVAGPTPWPRRPRISIAFAAPASSVRPRPSPSTGGRRCCRRARAED